MSFLRACVMVFYNGPLMETVVMSTIFVTILMGLSYLKHIILYKMFVHVYYFDTPCDNYSC